MSTLPPSERSTAIAPATCGAAMLVPDRTTPFVDVMLTPGAERSVHSPKLVNPAGKPFSLCAATVKVNGSPTVADAGDSRHASALALPAPIAKYRPSPDASLMASLRTMFRPVPREMFTTPLRPPERAWCLTARATPRIRSNAEPLMF